MNIIADLTARIERRATETKSPCKMYGTEAAATKAVAKIAARVANHHHVNGDARPARFVVFYIDSLQKWVGAIDLTECINRHDSTGGYVGLAAAAGFYTY